MAPNVPRNVSRPSTAIVPARARSSNRAPTRRGVSAIEVGCSQPAVRSQYRGRCAPYDGVGAMDDQAFSLVRGLVRWRGFALAVGAALNAALVWECNPESDVIAMVLLALAASLSLFGLGCCVTGKTPITPTQLLGVAWASWAFPMLVFALLFFHH